MNADLAVAYYMAEHAASHDYVPKSSDQRLREHLLTCEGPIGVKVLFGTSPLSDLTPDPETTLSCTIECPHLKEFHVGHPRYLGDMKEFMREMRDREERLTQRWAHRVLLTFPD